MIRKSIRFAVAFLILLSLLSGLAFAFAEPTESTATIIAASVRFRSGPATDYSVINTYPAGTQVLILGTKGDWTRCRINGISGYIYSAYLSEPNVSISVSATESPSVTAAPSQELSSPTPTAASTPAPTAASTPAPTAAPTPAPTAVVSIPVSAPAETVSTEARAGEICGDYVRFRTGPATTYTIINTYNKGKAVQINGSSNDWTVCTIDGTSGYVFSQYVKETVAASPVANTESSQAAAPAADSATATVTATENKPGYISGNNVRFRSGPSLSADIIGEFYFANAVTITGSSGDWTAVSADGKTGFVYSKYVKEGSYLAETAASSDSSESTGAEPSPSTDTGGIELPEPTASETESTAPEATPSIPETVTASSGADIVNYAMTFLGTNYCWGGVSPETGFDCSGFVYYIYSHFGITLNRVAQDQAKNGVHVDAADLQPGDILCFYSGSSITHAGIYIGDGKFIHSASSNTGVIVTQLAGHYSNRGYEARRIIGV